MSKEDIGKKLDLKMRSSAAEYLTYVSTLSDVHDAVELRYENENIWLTQKMLASLYGVSVPAINQHIKKVYEDFELDPDVTIKKFLIVRQEGARSVTRSIDHYNLQMIIAVGFKINNERAVQFRKWSGALVKDYTIQGWVMDEERLKQGGTILTNDYFEKQLQKIREIRLSERRFYQKITDIYATSLDYDAQAKPTRRFFASVQNKLHYSIHGNTAAELIVNRANAQKVHMGLTSWDAYPSGKIQKYDVSVAKNYLMSDELVQLERIVSTYLDFAELQAMRKIPMTMEDWEVRLNGFLRLMDREVLNDAGKVSAELAKLHAESEFEKFRVIQDRQYESDFDLFYRMMNQCEE